MIARPRQLKRIGEAHGGGQTKRRRMGKGEQFEHVIGMETVDAETPRHGAGMANKRRRTGGEAARRFRQGNLFNLTGTTQPDGLPGREHQRRRLGQTHGEIFFRGRFGS